MYTGQQGSASLGVPPRVQAARVSSWEPRSLLRGSETRVPSLEQLLGNRSGGLGQRHRPIPS